MRTQPRTRTALAGIAIVGALLVGLTGCSNDQLVANDEAADAVEAVLASLEAGDGVAVAEALDLEMTEAEAQLLDGASEHITDIEIVEVEGPGQPGTNPYGPRDVTATWTLAGEEQTALFSVGGNPQSPIATVDYRSALLATVTITGGPVLIGDQLVEGSASLLPGVYEISVEDGLHVSADTLVAAPGESVELEVTGGP